MKKLNPQQMLEHGAHLLEALEDAKRKAVFVGLPADKVGGAIYGDGMTVLQIGAIHEFGAPEQHIPERSFLRVPFNTKRAEVNKAIAQQFERIADGRQTVPVGLGKVGVTATNISKGAFRSAGYGTWAPLKAATTRAKGSGTPLIDTGTLRSSINWAVRNAS